MTSITSPLEIHARRAPDGVAYRLVPSGRTVTWRELELRSRKLAAAMHGMGLRPGDGIAVMLENHPRYFEILWAAQRSGLYYTPISRHLRTEEVSHIVRDCGARMLLCSAQTLAELDAEALRRLPAQGVVLDGPHDGFAEYESLIGAQGDDVAIDQRVEGLDFCYSSEPPACPRASSARWRRPASISRARAMRARTGRTSTSPPSTSRPRPSITRPRCAGTWR